jgi:hypothetical protein
MFPVCKDCKKPVLRIAEMYLRNKDILNLARHGACIVYTLHQVLPAGHGLHESNDFAPWDDEFVPVGHAAHVNIPPVVFFK